MLSIPEDDGDPSFDTTSMSLDLSSNAAEAAEDAELLDSIEATASHELGELAFDGRNMERRSRIFEASFNFTNSIVGAGIIGSFGAKFRDIRSKYHRPSFRYCACWVGCRHFIAAILGNYHRFARDAILLIHIADPTKTGHSSCLSPAVK